MHFEAVEDFLKSGHRLSKPELCPKHIYHIMLQCWNEKHWLRPTFSKLKILLQVRIFQQKQITTNIVNKIDPDCR